PLCRTSDSRRIGAIPVSKLLSLWEEQLGIDIRSEIGGIEEIAIQRCSACTLEFFAPTTISGSPDLYAQLQKFDWYYMPAKWEHDVEVRDLSGARRGLEVGCGLGDFVERVRRQGIAFEGCELNPKAVAAAHAKGLPVHQEHVEGLASSNPGAY